MDRVKELNKITIDSEEHITIDINQDPINQQLVFDVSNQLQSASPVGLYNFKLLILASVSSSGK